MGGGGSWGSSTKIIITLFGTIMSFISTDLVNQIPMETWFMVARFNTIQMLKYLLPDFFAFPHFFQY